MGFAENTSVPVERSRAEIERLIVKYGATSTAFMSGPDKAMILFEAQGRRVMFTLPLPDKSSKKYLYTPGGRRQRTPVAVIQAWEQDCRQRWRALALVIKAKLEAVASGITEFEDEFLAHIVMPDGKTVATHVKPRIAAAYDTNSMQPLLPGPN